jgi:RecJ-like exonuclease
MILPTSPASSNRRPGYLLSLSEPCSKTQSLEAFAEPEQFHGVTNSRRYAMADTERRNPGDEDVPGTNQTGENICPTCSGSGSIGQKPCPDCGGSGRVTVIVGDA